MTTSPVTVPEVRVRGRFYRSVQLERDFETPKTLSDYVVTPTARELTQRVVQELQRPGGSRTWSITGPYGTGKSSFALFLARLLSGEVDGVAEAEQLRSEYGFDLNLVPVLVVGRREPLVPVLLDGLARAMEMVDRDVAAATRKLGHSKSVGAGDVAEAFEDAARVSAEAGREGLVVIIDEFGKFLEQVSASPDHEDLYVLQALAESASRNSPPIVVATILHSSFSSYLSGGNDLQRAEWLKVQGRFTEVAFHEPPEQVLRLVGEALDVTLDDEVSDGYLAEVASICQGPALEEARRRLPIPELLPRCIPIDPVTALILAPLFRSKLAQNERSLFSFLTSEEPFGFQEFVRRADLSLESLPFYRLPRLYDYVSSSLGMSAFRGLDSRRWVEIDQALDRVDADAPELTRDAIKAVGLLWMYGAPVGLRASADTIAVALGDASGANRALAYLKSHSIVVYRRFQDAFALWEGSDVDLDQRYTDALSQVSRGNVARRLSRLVTLQPMVARAHYIETGTLRFFDVSVVDGEEKALTKALSASATRSDGHVVFVLSESDARRSDMIALATGLTGSQEPIDRLRIVGFPKPLVGLEDAITEVEVWQWVRDNTPALSGDQVALKELVGATKIR